MPRYMYERLSAQDNGFLVAEHTNAPLHIAAVGIYERGVLATRDGGVDIRRGRNSLRDDLAANVDDHGHEALADRTAAVVDQGGLATCTSDKSNSGGLGFI